MPEYGRAHSRHESLGGPGGQEIPEKTDRRGERAFRLSRFEGAVHRRGRAGSYAVPAGHVPEVALEAELPEPEGTAVVRVRHGRGHTLRRHATRTTELDESWAEIELPFRRGTTDRDGVALGTHAVAVSPPELVDAVRSALASVARAHEGLAQQPSAVSQPAGSTRSGESA